MVKAGSTAGGDNATGVVLEGGLVSLDGDGDWAKGDCVLESLGRVKCDIVVGENADDTGALNV